MNEDTTPAEDREWSPAEHALLDAALEFYGAADDVIDYAGEERPRLRRDALGFQAVRASMSLLEQRIRTAHAAGVTHEQISRITRLEPDIVAMILARGDDQATTT